MSKGSGYRYFAQQLAVGDGRRPRHQKLRAAQAAAGVPPGVWVGRALPAVGLAAGAEVTEDQMRNLFGLGQHPDAEEITAARLILGSSPVRAERAALLGYRVQKWTGADLVFRPCASVQLLWALGGPVASGVVEAAHERVMGEVVDQIETGLLIVRVGKDSIPERAVPGIIAARFRHHDNRDGRPLLHDHLVVSVKVQREDDRWGTLHSRTLQKYTVALSEYYNLRLLEEVCTDLGLATEPRYPSTGQRPVMEIAGIPEELIDWSATRHHATAARLKELADQYRSRTSAPLTVKIRHRMMERASTDTRPAKKTMRPLPDLRRSWRAGAIAAVGQDVVDGLLRLARLAAAAVRRAVRGALDLAAAALEVTAIVATYHGGRIQHHLLLAEARRYLARTLRGQPAPPRTDTTIVTAALRDHCRDITPTTTHHAQPQPYAARTYTPNWNPTPPPARRTSPPADHIHYRARAAAAQRAVLDRVAHQPSQTPAAPPAARPANPPPTPEHPQPPQPGPTTSGATR